MVRTYNGEMFVIPTEFEEEIRADERAKVLDEVKEIIATKTNPMYWIEKMIKENARRK